MDYNKPHTFRTMSMMYDLRRISMMCMCSFMQFNHCTVRSGLASYTVVNLYHCINTSYQTITG